MQTVNIEQDIKTNPVGARRDTALVPSLWGPMMMHLTENSLSFVCTGGIGNHRSAGTFSNAPATICLIVKQLKWFFLVSMSSSLSISIATKWEVKLHGAFNEYSFKTQNVGDKNLLSPLRKSSLFLFFFPKKQAQTRYYLLVRDLGITYSLGDCKISRHFYDYLCNHTIISNMSNNLHVDIFNRYKWVVHVWIILNEVTLILNLELPTV